MTDLSIRSWSTRIHLEALQPLCWSSTLSGWCCASVMDRRARRKHVWSKQVRVILAMQQTLRFCTQQGNHVLPYTATIAPIIHSFRSFIQYSSQHLYHPYSCSAPSISMQYSTTHSHNAFIHTAYLSSAKLLIFRHSSFASTCFLSACLVSALSPWWRNWLSRLWISMFAFLVGISWQFVCQSATAVRLFIVRQLVLAIIWSSVCLYVCLSICPSASGSICLSWLWVCLSVSHLYIRLYARCTLDSHIYNSLTYTFIPCSVPIAWVNASHCRRFHPDTHTPVICIFIFDLLAVSMLVLER